MRYQCEQCDWSGDRDAATVLENPADVIKPGQTFTDRKCPACSYHCFPAREQATPTEWPPVALRVTQDNGAEAWANVGYPYEAGDLSCKTIGSAYGFDRVLNHKHATLWAASGEMYLALEPLAARAEQHGFGDISDDATVTMFAKDVRAAVAAIAKAKVEP